MTDSKDLEAIASEEVVTENHVNSEEAIASAQNDDIKSGVDLIELKIAKDMAKRSVFLFVPVALLLGILIDYEAGIAVLFAGAVIVGNMFIAAEITRRCARISPSAVMAGALGDLLFD